MQIYVDADGFPRAAKEILLRAALRLGVPVVFVANKPIRRETSWPTNRSAGKLHR
jgi:uncharacterized protein